MEAFENNTLPTALLQERLQKVGNEKEKLQQKKNDITIQTYILNVKNGRGMAFIELHFDKSQEDLFNAFKFHLSSMQSQTHPDIQFKEREIGVYFKPLAELDDTINMIAEILDRMLKYFSPYTYKC